MPGRRFASTRFAGYHCAPFAMDLETEIKELIIESLMLDDVTVEGIDSSAPLFVEGLGLDSIDALELAMAIDKKFGVRVRADDEANKQIFANVKNLAAYVAANRK
jgi:acyl carrier protein